MTHYVKMQDEHNNGMDDKSSEMFQICCSIWKSQKFYHYEIQKFSLIQVIKW